MSGQLAMFDEPQPRAPYARREADSVWAAIVFLRKKGLRVLRARSGVHLINGQTVRCHELIRRAEAAGMVAA